MMLLCWWDHRRHSSHLSRHTYWGCLVSIRCKDMSKVNFWGIVTVKKSIQKRKGFPEKEQNRAFRNTDKWEMCRKRWCPWNRYFSWRLVDVKLKRRGRINGRGLKYLNRFRRQWCNVLQCGLLPSSRRLPSFHVASEAKHSAQKIYSANHREIKMEIKMSHI